MFHTGPGGRGRFPHGREGGESEARTSSRSKGINFLEDGRIPKRHDVA